MYDQDQESPRKKSKSKNKKVWQKWDPIPEDDEAEDQDAQELKRQLNQIYDS